MKKFLAILMSVGMLCTLAACGSGEDADVPAEGPGYSGEELFSDVEPGEDDPDTDEGDGDEGNAPGADDGEDEDEGGEGEDGDEDEGDGEETGPEYEGYTRVSDEAGLRAIADDREGKYVLTADIELSSAWETPKKFSGVLDGNGHTISGVDVVSDRFDGDDDSLEYYLGFFGKFEGTLRNVSFEDFTITLTADTMADTSYEAEWAAGDYKNLDVHAGVVAQDKGTMEGVSADVSVYVAPETADARLRVGGLAGKASGDITGCSVTGEMTLVNRDGYIRAGGLAGYVSANAAIEGCSSSVYLSAAVTDDAKIQAGGLIGNVECGAVSDCSAAGTVTVSNAGKKKDAYAAGFIGYADNTDGKYDDMTVTVEGCSSECDVYAYGKAAHAAGFIGYIETGDDETKAVCVTDCSARGSLYGEAGTDGFVIGTNEDGFTSQEWNVFSGNTCEHDTADPWFAEKA